MLREYLIHRWCDDGPAGMGRFPAIACLHHLRVVEGSYHQYLIEAIRSMEAANEEAIHQRHLRERIQQRAGNAAQDAVTFP